MTRHLLHMAFAAVLVAGVATAASGVLRPEPAYAATRFVEGTEDVPLMAGLVTVEGAGTVFDTAQGRIVESYAKGAVVPDAVLAFYAQTLPQLGWQAISATAYRREGEVLRLELYPEAGGLTVRFYLSPS